MDAEMEAQLREAGDELTEKHDEAVIADVIGEVEALDDESSEQTAELLRTMVRVEE